LVAAVACALFVISNTLINNKQIIILFEFCTFEHC